MNTIYENFQLYTITKEWCLQKLGLFLEDISIKTSWNWIGMKNWSIDRTIYSIGYLISFIKLCALSSFISLTFSIPYILTKLSSKVQITSDCILGRWHSSKHIVKLLFTKALTFKCVKINSYSIALVTMEQKTIWWIGICSSCWSLFHSKWRIFQRLHTVV